MTPEAFEQKQFELSVQAGTNQRYHQARADYFRQWDRGFKIAVGGLAVIGLCVSIGAGEPSDLLYWGSIVTGAVSALAAIALNVIPFGDYASEHQALFQRWTDFREDVDVMELEFAGKITRELLRRLKDLEAKRHRICGSEPGCRKSHFDACYKEEYSSRLCAADSHATESGLQVTG